ncbi:hypothetical protein BOTBODRAFT_186328 [Botryobasidium botryosum FD-172 SS1]|uniref:Amine oxidase domain-containing protein n=1 Tax=Botryobasidium botryosum (strain FD-172 SS1) TaxID=930990 RepID=A0A067MLM9_BOTB1|nr:hypothetical protein BOTBODRAFT_186328 [Botryobasidium botryosum FD-172 SS1]
MEPLRQLYFHRARCARERARKFQLDQITSHTNTNSNCGNSTPRHPDGVPCLLYPSTRISAAAPILRGDIAQEDPERLTVGIIGAGAAGLYAAMILDDLSIAYEILEGSDRVGGRVRTHYFEEDQSQWNYFDVGAMRFPDTPAMYRTHDLLKNRLGLGNKFVANYMADVDNNQIVEYNGIRLTQTEIDSAPSRDWFNDSVENGGLAPATFVDARVDHWIAECFQLFRDAFAEGWDKGWALVLKYNQHTVRSFMGTKVDDRYFKKEAYPTEAVNWLEKMTTCTGALEFSLSEAVMENLHFNFTSQVSASGLGWLSGSVDRKRHSLAGGGEVFIAAMAAKLSSKPKLSRRITAIFPATDDKKPISVAYADPDAITTSCDYLISTMPVPNLQFINLDRCNPTYAQRQALRSLSYGSTVKIELKFKSRWWQERCGIRGGVSKTDRLLRNIIYPSYGLDDPDADAVLIACYMWAQDAQRLASLIKGHDTVEEKLLVDLALDDLTALHGFGSPEFLRDQFVDHLTWDWSADPFATGCYASFGPVSLVTYMPLVASLLLAGESFWQERLRTKITGKFHSESIPPESVLKVLCAANLTDKIQQLRTRWGNPNVPEDEDDEMCKVVKDQAFLGTLFSAGGTWEEVEEWLQEYTLSDDWQLLESLGIDILDV